MAQEAAQLVPRVYNAYSVSKSQTLAASPAAAESITLQQPASGAKTVVVDYVFFHTTAAAEFSIKRDGTAASATALTVNKLNAGAATSTVSAYYSSNVGAGSAVAGPWKVAANSSLELGPDDLQGLILSGTGTARNLTFYTNQYAGTSYVIVKWREV